MYSFCPHCTGSIDQEQTPGRMLVCVHCRKEIGFIEIVKPRAAVDQTEELIRGGTVARCPTCQQAVELKATGTTKKFVPHYGSKESRKICAGSGKLLATESSPPAIEKRTPTGKDLSAFMTREVIKVISCQKNAEPTIEVLTLEYLDKTDRVRIQIEALREMLGSAFRMRDYPPGANKPHLGLWGNAEACVVAKKHEQGGMLSIADAEIAAVVADVRQHKDAFFA